MGSSIFGHLSIFLPLGQTSRSFFMRTDANARTRLDTAIFIGFNSPGGGQAAITAFEPTPVPIAPAPWLSASGLLGFVALARRASGTAQLDSCGADDPHRV